VTFVYLEIINSQLELELKKHFLFEYNSPHKHSYLCPVYLFYSYVECNVYGFLKTNHKIIFDHGEVITQC